MSYISEDISAIQNTREMFYQKREREREREGEREGERERGREREREEFCLLLPWVSLISKFESVKKAI
jgi:hypothetical protein